MIHVDHNQGVIRFYEEGKGYETKDPYVASLHFVSLSPETIFAGNMIGRPEREHYSMLYDELKSRGIKRVLGYFPTKWVAKGFKQIENTDLHMMELN